MFCNGSLHTTLWSFRCGDPTNSGAVAGASKLQGFTSTAPEWMFLFVQPWVMGSVIHPLLGKLLWHLWKNDKNLVFSQLRCAMDHRGTLTKSRRALPSEISTKWLIVCCSPSEVFWLHGSIYTAWVTRGPKERYGEYPKKSNGFHKSREIKNDCWIGYTVSSLYKKGFIRQYRLRVRIWPNQSALVANAYAYRRQENPTKPSFWAYKCMCWQ